MNVLMLTQWYPNQKQPYLGVFVREHAIAIASAGHNVRVVNISLHQSSRNYIKTNSFTEEYGVKVIQCEIHTFLKNILFHLPTLQEILLKNIVRDLLEHTQYPDLIHSHVIYPAGLWGHNLAKSLKIPHVITEHWSQLDKFSKGIYSLSGYKAYASAKAILPVSLFLKHQITDIYPGLSEKKFKIIGNVVNSSVFNYSPDQKNTNILTFCAVATWQHKKIPDKLPEIFIDALSMVQKKITQHLQLTIVGGGNKVEELKARCMQLGIHARFTGFIPKTQIAEELKKSDFFVHASTIETFSIVVAEALSCGLPVVCSDTGALPELVNSSNGIVCQNTPEEWEKAILRIIRTPFNNRQIAQDVHNRFSYESIGRQITNAYLQ